MAAFRLGVILGKWNIRAESDGRLPDDDNETLLALFSALDATDELKEKVHEAFVEYNTADNLSKITIPYSVYIFARRLILNREILA